MTGTVKMCLDFGFRQGSILYEVCHKTVSLMHTLWRPRKPHLKMG